MSNFNEELNKSLHLLYDQAYNFNISIDLIQKLAQQFNLETFVEDNRFQSVPNSSSSKKLTIAASSILLDIDFENDETITDVSISINGNEKRDVSNESFMKIDNDHVIIDQESNPMSLINTNDDKSVVEEIIFKCLIDTSKKLNEFPKNLKYLATIDRYTNDNQDLFSYIESVSLLLYSIWKLECEKLDSWQAPFVSSVGRVQVNDIETRTLGITLQYWQDYRYINNEYQKSTNTMLIGRNHTLEIDIIPSQYSIDYLYDIKDQMFKLQCGLNYNFEFANSIKPVDDTNGWSLRLNLNHAIVIPTAVFEFLGLLEFEKGGIQNTILDNIYEKLNNEEEFTQDRNIESACVNMSLINDFPYTFIPISRIKINKLQDLTVLLPILRNHLLLNNIYNTLFDEKNQTFTSTNQRRKRSSRLSISNNDKALSDETKEKLKESLRLSKDVTDEEIISLSAISETANYSTVKPMKDEIDLDSFMNSDNNEERKVSEKDNFMDLHLSEVNFITGDLHLILNSSIQSRKFQVKFKISNGELMLDNDENDMDSNLQTKFIKALTLTEDILIAYKSIY